ncbi:MAG: FIST signal transduction protein [Alphaproteobacteria bacterium]
MSLFTSTDFASVCAQGTDWRDTSKKVLEQLEIARTKPDYFNFGFLYVSDHLCDDTVSILNLFKSVLGIDHWTGTNGIGVIGCGEAISDAPAISAMICRFPENSFCLLEPHQETLKVPDEWLKTNTPLFSIIHGNLSKTPDLQNELKDIETQTNSFLVGGLGSVNSNHINGEIQSTPISGTTFASDVSISTMPTQGVKQVSPFHTITKADGNIILEINNKRALDVFQKDLRILAARKLKKTPEEFITELQSVQSSDQIPEEFQSLFQGQIHVALPSTLSDQRDYLVRDITNIDPDIGSISISEHVGTGDTLLLVERNYETICSDLANNLVRLRKRIQNEKQCFAPKAALYISCIERCAPRKDPEMDPNYEMHLIQDVIGDIPLTGFYAGGEIHNARLYGYTGILTLFF